MLKIFLLIIFFNFHINVFAQESDYFLMLKYNEVNVRYGPSKDDQIKFIYKKKYLPLKVIDKKENFRKIIDHKNNGGWIHISQLKSPKSLVILENKVLFKKERFGLNPKSKVKHYISERKVVVFSPSKIVKNKLNGK